MKWHLKKHCYRLLHYHIHRLRDGKLSKDIFDRELTFGPSSFQRHLLSFQDVVKRDMKGLHFDTSQSENLAHDRQAWGDTLKELHMSDSL